MKDRKLMIDIEGLLKCKGNKVALDNINISLSEIKKTAIIGETGSGKSTFLKCIAGLEQPDKGILKFKGERISGSAEKLVPGHEKIAYLSQHFELRNNYRVAEILSYDNLLTDQDADKIYRICDIAHLYERWTDELSGGERQRIALAKMLTTKPDLVLLDEPYSNLDDIHKNEIKNLINQIINKQDIAVILVTHDAADLLSWAEHVIIFKNGKIIQQGEPVHLFHNPADEYCAALMGSYALLDKQSIVLKKIIKASIADNRRLLIRPSYFTIAKADQNNKNAVVVNKEYFGNYTLYHVNIEGEIIKIAGSCSDMNPGHDVSVSFNRVDAYLM